MSTKAAKEIFAHLDKDEDGKVSVGEFLAGEAGETKENDRDNDDTSEKGSEKGHSEL